MPILFGFIFSLFLTFFLLYTINDPWSLVNRTLILENVGAIIIELLSEPFYIMASVLVGLQLKARVEGFAFCAKILTTLLIIKFSSRDPSLAFADGQLMFALVAFFGYATILPKILKSVSFSYINSMPRILLSDKAKGEDRKHSTVKQRRHKILNTIFYSNSKDCVCTPFITHILLQCEKLVLAEGSKYVLISLQRLYDEGVYGLVSNLGSLFVRLVLQPFEEASFNEFSRSASSKSTSSELKHRAEMLTSMIRFVSLFGFLVIIYGPPSSSIFLFLIYSSKWSRTQAPFILACYCPYIALMALNGITEAFVHAVVDNKRLAQSNIFMLIAAALHMVLTMAFVSTGGSIGLVIADCCNMIIRIAYSLRCIKDHFPAPEMLNLSSAAPTTATVISGGLTLVTLTVLRSMIEQYIGEGLSGVACYISVALASLLGMLYLMVKHERGAWDSLQSLRKSNKQMVKSD